MTTVPTVLQLVPKLNTNTMNELERILDNKPIRPPMVSTLALRWQSVCPPGGGPMGGNGAAGESSPKEDSIQEETREQKLPFCTIQWQEEKACSPVGSDNIKPTHV
jgi:hypothetical protein